MYNYCGKKEKYLYLWKNIIISKKIITFRKEKIDWMGDLNKEREGWTYCRKGRKVKKK